MNQEISFETPENIELRYTVAGLGTRFLAWLLDMLYLFLFMMALIIAVLIMGIGATSVLRDLLKAVGLDDASPEQLTLVMFGLAILVFGLGSFFYFGFFELLLRGQTLGKRHMGLRVVQQSGFALDPLSILIRSVFRVVDQMPIFWIVPLVTKSSQRLGDLAAGTVVVVDKKEEMTSAGLRDLLLARPESEARFRFPAMAMQKLTDQDMETIERLLERAPTLAPNRRSMLFEKIVVSICQRLDLESPESEHYARFLEDLLAACLRKQYRALG